jgi:uncharacterized glyoxalase superfamily protein PhnB
MRAMRIKGIVPMLAVGDMEASVAFYRDALGFSVRDKFESGGRVWWCEMARDGQPIMLTRHEVDAAMAGARAGFEQTSINIYLDAGIEALHERLANERRGVSELRVTFYGMKEFDLKDPVGYTLVIGQATNEPPTVVEDGAPPF